MTEKTTLTLSRYPGESIAIGDDIVVIIQKVKSGKQVRISIMAPREIKIQRSINLTVDERLAYEKLYAE